ncbi:Methyl farnesoate epoxidase [Orchesella cincta]|uniref:Methyl farnesoate epoxidase n=1 Tax=Orchesella cincta TaxID=48709 RepID=A0A1D2M9I4_ORCCI|nr:Methyl farnesoate epoxidase [Orchesella cincta]
MTPLLTFSEAALTLLALLMVFFYFWKTRKDPRYPPGPTPIPFFGNVLQLGRDPSKVMQNWADKYGPIYSIRMGNEDTIVVNDSKLVKELFSNASSTGRPSNPILRVFGGGLGIVQAQGNTWEAQRRFTLRKLRDVGVLKSSIEGFLVEEASTLIKYLERNVGKSISGKGLFNGPVVNSLWRIVSGETNDWDSPVKPEILKRAENCTRTVSSGLMFAPFLRHIAPGFFGWTEWVKSLQSYSELTNQAIENHARNLDPNNPQDFIDHYLVEMQDTTDQSSTFYRENGELNLRAVAADLFVAGSETSSATLAFAILFLLLNKEAQRKAQLELDQVVGSFSQISLSHKTSLPYTEAIVLETLRLSTIAPFAIPHRMLEDTMFHGYLLPKDVTIMSDLHAIHHDPKIWGPDVNSFRPERFLNQTETQISRHESLISFGAGRRSCLGEGLAKDTLFLFIASILHKFNIEQDPQNPVFKVETQFGMVVEPKPFKFMVSLRN